MSTVLGVFARANHPEGYGQCQGLDMGLGGQHRQAKAHGYVIVVVKCAEWKQLEAVKLKLGEYHYEDDPDRPGLRRPMSPPGVDPWKRGDAWYAGPYEFVYGVVADLWPATARSMHGQPMTTGDRLSYGDNRALAYLGADEVLEW